MKGNEPRLAMPRWGLCLPFPVNLVSAMKNRHSQRLPTRATGSCRTARGMLWNIQLDDLSAGGCRLEDPRGGMALGEHVRLFIAGTGPHIAEVAWRQGTRVGLEFRTPLSERIVALIVEERYDEATSAFADPGSRGYARRSCL